MDKRGVEYQDFPSKTFCLAVPRKFVGKPFIVSLPLGAEEVWIREGGGSIKIFRRENFLSHSAEKFSTETFSVSLISIMEKIFASEGYVTTFDFLLNFFCLTVPKNLVRKHLVFH